MLSAPLIACSVLPRLWLLEMLTAKPLHLQQYTVHEARSLHPFKAG